MIRLPIILFLIGAAVPLRAQDLLSTAVNVLGSGAAEKGTRELAALDSVDFGFAISVNENAGFFDIEQKGESRSKLLYGFKSEDQKTLVEKMRDTLEYGLGQYDLRRLQTALRTVQRARVLMEENGLKNEMVYLRILSSLGMIYLAQGKTTQSEKYIVESLRLSATRLGKHSPAYVANLNNYAKLHQSFGKYNEAEKEFEEALTLAKDVFGDGMQKAIIINNTAMLFQTIGRHAEAADLMKQAMVASEGTPKKALQGKKSFDNRKFQANLAFIYQLSGEYAKAEENFLAIKKASVNRGQTGNAEYAGLLNQMGILYIQMGKMELVEENLKKAKEIYRKRYGEMNPYFAKATNDLGNFYRLISRYPEAETELRKALSIRESWLGTKHPDYVRSQEDLAILLWKTGRFAEAHALYIDVLNKTMDFIGEYFPPMSEAEKTNFWDITAPRFQRFFNFAIEASGTINTVARDLLDYRLATKALLLNSTSKVQSSILQSNDQALIQDYLAWIDQKEELVRLYSYSKKKLKDQDIDLEALKRSANSMEKSLSERSAAFSAGYTSSRVTAKKLAESLGDDEAVVDIVRINGFKQDFTNDLLYIALVLKKGMETPLMVRIDDSQKLEARGVTFYRNTIRQKMDDSNTFGLFWKKIENEILDKKVVYVSPDGAYNQINLNTLQNAAQEYLISKHDFVILGNSKDLVSLKNRKALLTKKSALLVGFPDYKSNEVAALPGTKVEVEAVSSLLQKDGYAVSLLTQQRATEGNIKMAKGFSVLHIATHGYFLNDAENDGGSVFGINAENARANPLLRSGLILAGAGRAINGMDQTDLSTTENGILTAYEAMNLNLEGTRLVVLSACETGLGEVKSGEGVYGLQRSFIVAGAEALIMSLWKVDDEATQALMTNFYSNWIKSGDKGKAFKLAQQQLMETFKEPYYWGAFVMVGN